MTTIPTSAPSPTRFDIAQPLPTGRLALEASAGTGKTWTIAALVLRWVVEEGLALESLLVVTFTRAATAELRDRIRRRLVEAHRHLDAVVRGGQPTTDDPVLAALARDVDGAPRAVARLARALADFDAATITTIHGFCHQVLAASGFRGDLDGAGTLVEDVDDLVRATARDLLVGGWADVPGEEQGQRPAPALAAAVGAAVLRDPTVPVRPDPAAHDLERATASLVQLADDLRQRVDGEKRRRGILTYDDLLLRLRDSLLDPVAGADIREAMRERYRVALIDEFQDTDPVQWSILSSLFEGRPLVLIGDPKQAIYRFRGADVHAYLDAVATSGGEHRTLGTNHRSDGRLVEVCNRLFEGVTFGDGRITHHDVQARHDEDRLRFADGPRPVFEVRASVGGGGVDVHRPRIAADLAAEITHLLASRATLPDPDAPTGRRPVRPGDCAVLVRANKQAEDVKDALGRVGVHAVVNGVGSVLETRAADDWRRLLSALERPSSRARVRALALSDVVGLSAAEVAESDADEDLDAQRHDQVLRWSRVLSEHGIATLVRTIQRETRMPARLLSVRGGDRWLADFEHIAELLHTAAAVDHLGASALLAWLVEQRWSTDELPADQRARRLESDALAVQVLTIHRSKGLQFPIVYCPYVMSHGSSPRIPINHHDPDLGRSVLHLGGPGEGRAKELARHEDLGEQLRLLYVAMTRAEHRLVAWWFPLSGAQHSPFQKLLFGDGAPVRAAADAVAPKLKDAGRDPKAFAAAVGRLGPSATWCVMPTPPSPVPWVDPGASTASLAARDFTGHVDGSWQRSSFSAMTRPVPGRGGGVLAGLDEVAGRHDEHDRDLAVEPADVATGLPLPLGAQPAGAAFGTMVHHVLEHVDFTAADLPGALASVRRAHRHGVVLRDPSGLDAGLAAALATPMGPAFDGRRLVDVPRTDRLDELPFELPLAQGDLHVTLGSVADLLDRHLEDADPFRAYADDLRDGLLARNVHGWLTGSIDVVLRLRHGAQDRPRFHVVDHKTNRLFGADDLGTTSDYDGASMVAAMRHGHYVLQSLLYQVALHRWLRWRLPDHDPEHDLGAVGYLFVRGMVGAAAPSAGPGVPDGTPCGVMAWRPPTSLVLALSSLLDRGGRP